MKRTNYGRNLYSKISRNLKYCRLLVLILAGLLVLLCLEYSPPRSETVKVVAVNSSPRSRSSRIINQTQYNQNHEQDHQHQSQSQQYKNSLLWIRPRHMKHFSRNHSWHQRKQKSMSNHHGPIKERMMLPEINDEFNFTKCEIDSGWPLIRQQVTHRQDVCRPRSLGTSKKLDRSQHRPVSRMTCWDAKGADGFVPKLCAISNLYAEIEAGSGNVTWRLFGCSRGQTADAKPFVFRLRKIPLYREIPLTLNNENSTFSDTNFALNYPNVSQWVRTLNESLGISFYGMAPNVWHAMADVNAHWLSFHLLKERLSKKIFDPNWNWTVIQIKGTYTHKSNIEYLYSRLWDKIVFHYDPKEYIKQQVEWNDQIDHNILVRIPNVMFPAIHWFGLPWRSQLYCPLSQKNRNPVYLQWQRLVNHWMNDLIDENGPRLMPEICDEKIDRFRLFRKRREGSNQVKQEAGFLVKSKRCYDFFTSMDENKNNNLLFFGDRHVDQRFTEEPCATHRCLANLNETRDALLARLNHEYSMIMGNPSALSLQSQYELLHRTDILFGMHGAMFSLSQFMREGSLLYEIQPHTGGRICTALANGLDLKYSLFSCARCDSRIDNIIKVTHAIEGLVSAILLQG